jgi:hypothetical protein
LFSFVVLLLLKSEVTDGVNEKKRTFPTKMLYYKFKTDFTVSEDAGTTLQIFCNWSTRLNPVRTHTKHYDIGVLVAKCFSYVVNNRILVQNCLGEGFWV